MTSWLRRAGVVAACLAALLAPACGSPTGPDGFDVTGNWQGTWQFVSAGATLTDEVTAVLTQSGSTASGTWSSASGVTGQMSFTPTSMMTGTLTITQMILTGQVCTATTALTGTASASRLEFMLADITPSGVCQWATAQRFLLTK
jgi:hypothetical protein